MNKLIVVIVSLLSVFYVMAEKRIYVDKPAFTLYVISDADTIMSAPVCLGKNPGQKRRAGDHKTPEGTFRISMIQDAHTWKHDFKDGMGKREGAYGPWFFRLATPQSPHIGIHGTCFPESVGSRQSDGCIRLRNEDLEALRRHVFVGMKVTVSED